MSHDMGKTTALTLVPPRINHVLIDHENVQPGALKPLDFPNVRVWIFVGHSQGKISTGLAIDAHAMADKVTFVQISAHGSNALDFHISYYLGKLCAEEPASYFHVLSGDTGFDPLVTHLRGQGRNVYRVKCIDSLIFLPRKNLQRVQPAPIKIDATQPGGTSSLMTGGGDGTPAGVISASKQSAMTMAQRTAHMRALLARPAGQSSRPGKRATLRNHVQAQFQKQITTQQADEVIASLVKAGVLKIQADKVVYL